MTVQNAPAWIEPVSHEIGKDNNWTFNPRFAVAESQRRF